MRLDQLPKSYMVSYKYHIGRLAVYEEDLQVAARELQQAFQLCKKEAQVGRRLRAACFGLPAQVAVLHCTGSACWLLTWAHRHMPLLPVCCLPHCTPTRATCI